MANYIVLNVGGVCYTTSRLTLTSYPGSMLGKMFGGNDGVPPKPDEKGHFFIDRDGTLFRYILNFMRSKKLCLPSSFEEYDQLIAETDFFGLPDLEKEIMEVLSSRVPPKELREPGPQNPVRKAIVILRSCDVPVPGPMTETMSEHPTMARSCVVEAEQETWLRLNCLKSARLITLSNLKASRHVDSYVQVEYPGNLHSFICGFIVQDGFKLEGTSSCDGNEALVFSKE